MITINDNNVTLNKTIKLTKKQLFRLNQLRNADKIKYLLSLQGLKANGLTHPKILHTNSTSIIKNKILNIQRQIYDYDKFHTPLTKIDNSLWVGVEIECYIEDYDDCNECNGHGNLSCCNCDGDGYLYFSDNAGNEYNVDCGDCCGDGMRDCYECESDNQVKTDLIDALRKNNVSRCTVKEDSSLNDNGLEIALLFDASKGFGPLERLCKVLNDFDATVDHKCGLHVHLDKSNLDDISRARMIDNFKQTLPILCALQPESRRNNQYCANRVSDQKYSAVNTSPTNTIEIRLHTGSVNFEKIKNWIMLLNIIKTNKCELPKFKKIYTFAKALKLPSELTKFYKKRYKKFQVSNEIDEEAS